MRRVKINEHITYLIIHEEKGVFQNTFFHDLEVLVYRNRILIGFLPFYNHDCEITNNMLIDNFSKKTIELLGHKKNIKKFKQIIDKRARA